MSYFENDSKEFGEISSIIDQLLSQSQQYEKDYESLEEIYTSLLVISVQFMKSLKSYEQMKAKFPPKLKQKLLQRKERETIKMQKLCKTFKVKRIVLLHNLNLIVETADYVLDEIVDKHLQKWRDNQKLGVTYEDQKIEPEVLKKIQNWCENLAKVLWSTRNKLRMGPMYKWFLTEIDETIPVFLPHIFGDVTKLLVCLVKSTVIIENQPPQVLLSNESFSTNIRLLVGDALNIKKMKPSVDVSIVSEFEAQNFEKLVEKSDLKCCKLNNCSGIIKFDNKSSKMVATFDALKLIKIYISGDNVTVEKFGLLFQSKLIVGDLEIYIKALSSPFIVNVDDLRKTNVIISWDNEFPVIDRQPFDMDYFWTILNFKLALRMTVCALSEKTLAAPKLMSILELVLKSMRPFALSRALSQDGALSSRKKLIKSYLRGNKKKFMEWFYSAIELTQNHLCELWNENYIIGFIDEKSAEKILIECKPGTFLLRLSDSQIVGLVIDYCALNKNKEKHVFHCEPLFSKELYLRSLPDRILEFVELKMLYQTTSPHINKDDAFGKYASNRIKQIADPMETDSSLLSLSDYQLNCAIDLSIPTSSSINTTPPMPWSSSSSFNSFLSCWSCMRNDEKDDQYNLLS